MILKLNKDILKRYEHHLNGGLLILYNVKTRQYWFGNAGANEIVRLIDGYRNLDDIYTEALPHFDGCSLDDLKQSTGTLIKELLDKEILVSV